MKNKSVENKITGFVYGFVFCLILVLLVALIYNFQKAEQPQTLTRVDYSVYHPLDDPEFPIWEREVFDGVFESRLTFTPDEDPTGRYLFVQVVWADPNNDLSEFPWYMMVYDTKEQDREFVNASAEYIERELAERFHSQLCDLMVLP